MELELENAKPQVFEKLSSRDRTDADDDENVVDPFDEREIFGINNKPQNHADYA